MTDNVTGHQTVGSLGLLGVDKQETFSVAPTHESQRKWRQRVRYVTGHSSILQSGSETRFGGREEGVVGEAPIIFVHRNPCLRSERSRVVRTTPEETAPTS